MNTENIQKAISMFDWQCLITVTLTNIFHNFIPHKTKKRKKKDYKTLESMNSMIISSLKEQKKLSKIFYKNFLDCNKHKLFSRANKCTNIFVQTKADSIARMSTKLDDPNLASNSY